MKIFVFDTETGGLDMRTNSLLSVGWLVGDLETGEILDQREEFVKLPSREDYNVTAEAFAVHNITIEQCMSEGVPPEEIRDAMMDMFVKHGAQLYGGHNVNIDVAGCSIHLFDMDPMDWPSTFTYRKIDSHDFIRLFLGTEGMKSGGSLTQIAKSLKIPTNDIGGSKYHAALFDAIVTFRIMCFFRKLFKDERLLPLIKANQ
jgi:DNA polymerase III epsilon subunit-like protein